VDLLVALVEGEPRDRGATLATHVASRLVLPAPAGADSSEQRPSWRPSSRRASNRARGTRSGRARGTKSLVANRNPAAF
jgi:hypothetical protein